MSRGKSAAWRHGVAPTRSAQALGWRRLCSGSCGARRTDQEAAETREHDAESKGRAAELIAVAQQRTRQCSQAHRDSQIGHALIMRLPVQLVSFYMLIPHLYSFSHDRDRRGHPKRKVITS